MLSVVEHIIYSILFLINKYLDLRFTENYLNWYENKIIKKYLVKKEITSTEIPTINANKLTNNEFVRLSNNFRNPVLIKGFMKDTKAVSDWNLDYLKEIIGNFEVNVLQKQPKLEIKTMKFNEFANRVESEHLYVNNNHTILSHFPALFNDLSTKFKIFLNLLSSANLRNIHIANFFIGCNSKDKINGSNMHCGGSGNFFCMIKGKKRWTLINPKYSCLLKGRVSESGIHGQTLFDMPDINLSQYPKMLTFLPRYDVTLEPGDILWNAPWWWHRIENSDDVNIGLAIRNNKVTKLNLLNNPTFTLSGYTYLLYNTYLIGLYEYFRLQKDQHFGNSKEEKNKSNVLYQIDKLTNKYPKSVNIDNIL